MSDSAPNRSESKLAKDTPKHERAAAPPADDQRPASRVPQKKVRRRKWPWIVGLAAAAVALLIGVPWFIETLNTVSTDDAYVSGHVTMVAPRVSGQVLQVLVDDNNVVHKGDLLVELDPEPYQVQVNIAEAIVGVAQADLIAVQAAVRGKEGLAQLVLQLAAYHRKC